MIQKLIEELERRCPGCSFTVSEDEKKIRLTEYGRRFVVDLEELGETPEEWFRREIEAHPADQVPELEPDEKYRVICPRCGPVVIGYGGYLRQMARPDLFWYCPICGETAAFDDEHYESYMEEQK